MEFICIKKAINGHDDRLDRHDNRHDRHDRHRVHRVHHDSHHGHRVHHGDLEQDWQVRFEQQIPQRLQVQRERYKQRISLQMSGKIDFYTYTRE